MSDVRERMTEIRKKRLLQLSQQTKFTYKDLTNNQEEELLNYILNLSEERQNLLVFKNYYDHTFDEIEDIFDIENAKGEYMNLVTILSENLGIKNAIISEKSMKNVCEKAASEIDNAIIGDFDTYSNAEITQLPKAKRMFRFANSINVKAASVILIIFISSGLIFGLNVYAEGKVFEWIVDTFEKYTGFNMDEENITDKNDAKIEVEYIPEGFELDEIITKNSVDIYYYKHNDQYIVIKIVYDSLNTGLNTENASVGEFELEGNTITTWEKSNKNYFVFTKDIIAYQIYGNLDRDEFIKIYENLSEKDE